MVAVIVVTVNKAVINNATTTPEEVVATNKVEATDRTVRKVVNSGDNEEAAVAVTVEEKEAKAAAGNQLANKTRHAAFERVNLNSSCLS